MDAETKQKVRQVLRREIKLLTHHLRHCEYGATYAITEELLARFREDLYQLREQPRENRRLSRFTQNCTEQRVELRREMEALAMNEALVDELEEAESLLLLAREYKKCLLN